MRPAHRLDLAWLLGPTLAVLGLFFFYPLGVAVYDSLFEWDLLTPPRYVGWANYQALFESGAFAEVLVTTLVISVTTVSGATLLGLALALAVNRPGRFAAFVRSSIFSAYVVS